MLSMKRGIFLLALSFAGLGISRGWFHVCSPCSRAERDKISMGIAVDSQKIGADLEQFSHKLKEKVASGQ